MQVTFTKSDSSGGRLVYSTPRLIHKEGEDSPCSYDFDSSDRKSFSFNYVSTKGWRWKVCDTKLVELNETNSFIEIEPSPHQV